MEGMKPMTHRVECGGTDDCTDLCRCWCHQRCGALMKNNQEPCWRRAGHRWEHRSRYALANHAASAAASR